ncbi:MAG: metal-sensing transcriptional repressor [Candidatus Ornithospirochaeta sp.]
MDCCCSEKKKTLRSEEEKKKLITRLNRIEGQIRGIRKMVEEDSYCMDVLVQASAASSAFSSFERELLSSHISGCVQRGIREGDESVVPELISILEKLVR